jgi:hypothetical protein
MAPDLVDDDAQAKIVRLRHQPVEIGERAEQRINLARIGHVVAEILHRRAEERRDPDRVDAKRGHVIELLDDAGQIAPAIAVGVAEARGIDFVDDGAPPPLAIMHGSFSTSDVSGFSGALPEHQSVRQSG